MLRTPYSYLTQKTIKIFINAIYSKQPIKNYVTNKPDVYHIEDIWSSGILDFKDFGPENNRGNSYVLIIVDKISNFAWTVLLKNKNAQTIKESFEYNFNNSKRKSHLIETDRGKKFYNSIFQFFLNNNTIIYYSRISSLGAVFAE